MKQKDGKKGNIFQYTYSAKDQAELRRIRQKYMPPEEDKMEQLRRLDRSVTQKGSVIALITGTLGALLLGIGMCSAMVWQGAWFIPGIIIGILGIGIISVAYPLYLYITKKEKERITPEILRLSEELMK